MVATEGDVLGRSCEVGMAERTHVGMVAVWWRFSVLGRGDRKVNGPGGKWAVSYTHLDVYKRQGQTWWLVENTRNCKEN